ncbi:hypothetical protein CMQ_2067 [Grosmannia clavigera kw1407]|uniref:Uncharacterized protein n=1 Tax=Grosmannia clavigera (strain kw1407 / UAMH 11150) TaxID=655863 RepID=F0XN60_GROCL|nr:uncharacterized protein CMQ_2067 [Grosmannia clavigera kw1407]EFX00986.1 hypothetical protein CMQ_2067 [Grosmannia clavigera kw1407]
MHDLTASPSTCSRDAKASIRETVSESAAPTATTPDAAPALAVLPESFSYFPYCSAPSPLAYATNAIASLSSCLRWSMTCNGNWPSPANLGFNSDRHHHQQQQQQQQQQIQSGYNENAAMSWPSDRKPYTHTPTHAASGFLTTSTADHMAKAQQDPAVKG